ncbi:MAG: flippase [Ignavibacteria bacterium]|nr:flippase [Ignavibacteria bacterium]
MRRTLKNTLINFSGLLLPSLVAVPCISIAVHGYGDEQYGLLSLAVNLLTSFAFLDLGIGLGTIKYVAEALAQDRGKELPAIVQTSFAVNLVVGLAFAAIILFAGGHGVRAKIPGHLVGQAMSMLNILAFSVPVITLSSTLRGVLEASQRFDLSNAVKIPSTSALFIIPALGVAFSLSVAMVTLLLVASRVLVLLAFAIMVYRLHPTLFARTAFRLETTVRMLKYGGWVSVTNGLTPILLHADKVLLASLIGIAIVPYYSSPYEFVTRSAIIPFSLAITLFPRFSGLRAEEMREVGEQLIQKSLRLLSVLLFPIMLTLIVFAPEILDLWLGPVFRERSTLTFQLLVVGSMFSTFSYIPFAAVQGLGRPDLKAKLDLAGVVLCLVGGWALIRGFGIEGAAVSRILVSMFDTVALIVFTKRILGTSFRQLFPSPLRGLFVLAFVLPVAGIALSASLPLRIVFAAGATAVFLGVYLKLYSRVDEALIRSVFRRGGAKGNDSGENNAPPPPDRA